MLKLGGKGLLLHPRPGLLGELTLYAGGGGWQLNAIVAHVALEAAED